MRNMWTNSPSVVIPFILARPFPTSAFVLRFIMRVAVTLHTIVEIANPLFLVFPAYFGLGVFVATITGKFRVNIVHMTGDTGGVVMLVQLKKLVMIKRGWFPGSGAMTLCTVFSQVLMYFVFRCDMTTGTLFPRLRFQQLM